MSTGPVTEVGYNHLNTQLGITMPNTRTYTEGRRPQGTNNLFVAWQTLPSWYAISGQDLIIDPDAQVFMSARAGSTVVRYDDASHAGAYTHYASRFVKLIEEAVAATAG